MDGDFLIVLEKRLIAGLIVVGFAFGCGAGESAGTAFADTETPMPTFAPVRGGGPAMDRFGIMAVPADPRSPEALRDLGLGWVRFSSQMGERVEREKRMFRQVAGLGYGMWLTLAHRDKSNAIEKGTVGFDRSQRGGFEPHDAEKYQALVRRTISPIVEELRAAGRRPGDWLVVQIENEVLPTDVLSPDKPVRFWHGTSGGYLRTLALAYDAVKSVDSSIRVACFGFSSEMLAEFVSGRHPVVNKWGKRVISEGKFDVADVHLYNKIEDITPKIAWVKSRWNGPLVATEVGGPDPAEGGDPSDDAALARELDIRMRAVINAGVDKAFWVLLAETMGADERFRKMGLIDRNWRCRPAFGAYQKLIAEYRDELR